MNVVVSALSPSAVVIIRIGYVPGGVVVDVVIEIVGEQDASQEVGVKVAFAPSGKPSAVNDNVWVTSEICVAVTVADVELPWSIVAFVGDTVRLKLNGFTVNDSVVVLTTPPAVIPLIVIG